MNIKENKYGSSGMTNLVSSQMAHHFQETERIDNAPYNPFQDYSQHQI